MRYIGTILAVSLALFMVVAVIVYSFLPVSRLTGNTSGVTTVASPVMQTNNLAVPDTAQLEADFKQQEALYLGQIAELQQALQHRQSIYEEQLQSLSQQQVTAQQQRDELTRQEQRLLDQLQQFENARAERVTLYRSQLEQAGAQYATQYRELQSALQDTLTKLAQANAQ